MYPLEFHYDVPAREVKEQEETSLNFDARGLQPRSNVVAVVDARMTDINAIDDDESDI